MGKRKFVRIFARIDNDGERPITYHLDSSDGPEVTPRRFYPARLVTLLDSDDSAIALNPEDLRAKAPDDERVNAYVLGDITYWARRRELSGRRARLRRACTNYCEISEEDLKKRRSRVSKK